MLVSFESFEAPPVTKVPNAKRLVVSGAEQVLATRMEDQTSHPIVVPSQRQHAEASRYVPDLDGFISRPRCQEWAREIGFFMVFAWCGIRRRGRQSRGFLYSCCCRFGSPCYAFDDVFVLSHFHLEIDVIVIFYS